MPNIRQIQIIFICLGIGTLIYASTHQNQIEAICGIGCFVCAIAFGLLRGEL